MQNAGYVALSRQMVLGNQLAVTANNIANLDTVGFKRQGLLFGEHLAQAQNGESASYVTEVGTVRDLSQGPLRTTDRQLDLALSGEGYFTVETPGGLRYSRNGLFQISADGELVTRDGHQLLDADGQRIPIPPNAKEIKVQKDGQFIIDGQQTAKIEILSFDNPQALLHTANGLYRASVPGIPAEETFVVQGMLEESNVNAVSELVYMLGIQQNYQASNKMLTGEHDRLTRAIREIGRVEPS